MSNVKSPWCRKGREEFELFCLNNGIPLTPLPGPDGKYSPLVEMTPVGLEANHCMK